MTLLEDINNKFKKSYVVTARCSNCKSVQDVKVPKGQTIKEYFESERGKCDNCGTACLEPYQKPREEKKEDKIKLIR